jgi:hypothetical protein
MSKPSDTRFISWEPTLHFHPTSLDPFTTHGIPVPTYGNYGGPGYTAGTLGGTTPNSLPDPAPVDPLDTLSSSSSMTVSSQTRQHLYKRACNSCSECRRSHTRILVRPITILQLDSMKGSGHLRSSVSCSSTPALSGFTAIGPTAANRSCLAGSRDKFRGRARCYSGRSRQSPWCLECF